MQTVATLGSLMGLAFTSGMRLYSTILALGLGIRFELLKLPDALAHLGVLASTPVLALAGVAYAAEFFADKIPWVDSAWDAIHTFIRPLGAAAIGAIAVGDVDPATRAGVFLLSGAIGLSSHSAKSGTRLLANHSPEPASNIGLSLAEDVLVVGGTWLATAHPVVALVIVLILVSLILWLVPKLVRLFRWNLARLASMFRPRAAGGPPPPSP